MKPYLFALLWCSSLGLGYTTAAWLEKKIPYLRNRAFRSK